MDSCSILVVDPDFALVRLVIHVQQLEDRRLSGSTRPGEEDELTLPYLKAYLGERGTRTRILFRDVGKTDHPSAGAPALYRRSDLPRSRCRR